MTKFVCRSIAPLALAILAHPGRAWADDGATIATSPPADRAARAPAEHLRIGAIAGVGFPRPLAIEALIRIERLVVVGAEYGILPTITISGLRTNLWSLAADARVFPFRGAFFVGILAGRQHVGASTTLSLGSLSRGSLGSLTEDLSLDSWFVNARLGFLWTSHAGLAFGIDAGVQVPVGTTVSSTLPLSLYPPAQRRVDSLGGTVLPTIDLLRLGLLF